MDDRIKRKQLKAVHFGPYIPNKNGRKPVEITSVATRQEDGSLRDPRMGFVASLENGTRCTGDWASCMGTMGTIKLDNPILNPLIVKPMLTYLKLFVYKSSSGSIDMVDGLRALVDKYSNDTGFRKLNNISKASGSKNPWSYWEEGGGVAYTIDKNRTEIRGEELAQILKDASERYKRGGKNANNVTLEDLGMNTDYTLPEYWISDDIPVLGNMFRNKQGPPTKTAYDKHQYTDAYRDIKLLSRSGEGKVSAEFTRFVYKNPEDKENTLKYEVYESSNDNSFLRNKMLSKVGGQIGRSVVIPVRNIRPDEIMVPRSMSKEISVRLEIQKDDRDLPKIRQFVESGYITHVFDPKTLNYHKINRNYIEMIGTRKLLVLRQLMDGDLVLANRQPTLHRGSILGFRVVLWDEATIGLHPSAAPTFGAD